MSIEPRSRHYVTIFVVSLALLMVEIAVARTLSVALVSHFAFVAISLAMFGIGLSGLVVYLFPGTFRSERLDSQLVTFLSLFAMTAALSMVLFLRINMAQEISVAAFLQLSVVYTLLAVPFFFGGLCVSLLMTHCSSQIGRIYFADLVGASLGCLGVILAMELASAPVVAVAVACAAAVLALVLARNVDSSRLGLPGAALGLVLVVLLLGLSTDLLRLVHVKGHVQDFATVERWNSFSRVTAFPSPKQNAAQFVPLDHPFSYYDGGPYPESMVLDIDGGAWTPLTNFDGDFSQIDYLRRSVLYIGHHFKPSSDVLIIGTGAGRDILAAKLFGQPSVLGLELNPNMRYIVQEHYGDYSGRPYTLPGVEVVIDEARSRLTSVDESFGLIQLSLIDTFSLNAAGGLVFSENYLYTKEAFQQYFRHLNDDGIFAVTRYYAPEYSVELLRLAGLARTAWEMEGVADPFRNIAVLGQGIHFSVLAKKSPYTSAEISRLEELATEFNIRLLYRPGSLEPGYESLGTLLTTPDFEGFVDSHPFLIGPPTDDQPFFFHLLRGRLAPGDIPGMDGDPFKFMLLWQEAILMMYMLVAVVTVLAAVFFFGPLLLLDRERGGRPPARIALPLLMYFACLGYGFMMIEIPLMQNFILFLGYPAYALAVVLMALLFFSGIGSLISSGQVGAPRRALVRVLVAIVVLGIAYLYLVPIIIKALLGISIPLRILATIVMLAPIGLVLGMAYPLGITVLRGYSEQLVAWAWGLNGALSVVASVFAIFIGSRFGFSVAFLSGIAAYAVGLILILVVPQVAHGASGAPVRLGE
jgi:spermidine synthase